MGRKLDRTGQRSGRLVAIREAFRKNGKIYWECVCDCGNHVFISGGHLTTGNTKSCGCYKIEKFKEVVTKHGKSGSPEYIVWKAMTGRCRNPYGDDVRDYGERGITVCERWKNSFENFYNDVGPRPEGTSIDRINNHGNYSPENCRWVTDIEQASNRRDNHYLIYNGEQLTLSETARRLHMNIRTLQNRVEKGVGYLGIIDLGRRTNG